MFCPECGKSIKPSWKICAYCGTRLQELLKEAPKPESGISIQKGDMGLDKSITDIQHTTEDKSAKVEGGIHISVVDKGRQVESGTCPICGKHNEVRDTFQCKKCGQEFICLKHQDEKYLVCSECANKVFEELESWIEKGWDIIYAGRDKSEQVGSETYERALQCFDKALKMNSEDVGAWHGKGYVLVHLKKHREALECLDRALDVDSESQELWFLRALIFWNLNRYEEVIVCLDKALEINPTFSEWELKAYALYNLNRYGEAITCLDEALEINPTSADVWGTKAKALNKLGRYEEAARCSSKQRYLDN